MPHDSFHQEFQEGDKGIARWACGCSQAVLAARCEFEGQSFVTLIGQGKRQAGERCNDLAGKHDNAGLTIVIVQ